MRIPWRQSGKYAKRAPDPRLTIGKLNTLKKKLARLKETDQPNAAREVAHLADGGDFSDNAGYQAAKGRLHSINQHISDLEDQVNHARVIALHKASGYVRLGSRVTLASGGREISIQILGSVETDPTKGIISDNSPVGASIMGKKIGDTVIIKLQSEKREYRIISIK